MLIYGLCFCVPFCILSCFSTKALLYKLKQFQRASILFPCRGDKVPKERKTTNQNLLYFVFRCAIFQEDCKVVTGPSPQVTIKLKYASYSTVLSISTNQNILVLSFNFCLAIRPYSNDMGFEDRDVSALLSVKCGCFQFYFCFSS